MILEMRYSLGKTTTIHFLHHGVIIMMIVLIAQQKELLAKLKTCKEDYVAVMKEYMRVKEVYDELARKLGR